MQHNTRSRLLSAPFAYDVEAEKRGCLATGFGKEDHSHINEKGAFFFLTMHNAAHTHIIDYAKPHNMPLVPFVTPFLPPSSTKKAIWSRSAEVVSRIKMSGMSTRELNQMRYPDCC
jgi:hypothetical protein